MKGNVSTGRRSSRSSRAGPDNVRAARATGRSPPSCSRCARRRWLVARPSLLLVARAAATSRRRRRRPRALPGLLADASRDCWTREFQAVGRRAGTTRGRRSRRSSGRPDARAASCSRTATGSCTRSGAPTRATRALTLADLMDYLPRSNDPGCSAGFAHGLVTGVAPPIDPRRPREAATVCADAGTRYQRYSCVHGLGHAFMRIYGDRLAPALALCRALGPRLGAGLRAGRLPRLLVRGRRRRRGGAARSGGRHRPARALRAAQPTEFVRPCWYRAFVDNRPDGIVVDSPRAPRRALRGPRRAPARGVHHRRLGDRPGRPGRAARDLRRPRGPRDAASCIRGTKVQNLLGASTDALRPADRPLRALRRRDAGRVLPLARQDDRRRHRRRASAHRLPAARARGRPPPCVAGARSSKTRS